MIFIRLILILMFSALASVSFATKYAGEIFELGAGVRNYAMGHSGVTDLNTSAPAFWNAALLEKIKQNKFEVMHAEEYEGLLKYDMFSAVVGKEQKFSLVLTRVGINGIPLTKLENPEDSISNQNRPYKYKTVNNSDFVLYCGFGRKLTEKISWGVTPKVAYRSLVENSGYGFGMDLGMYMEILPWMAAGAKINDVFMTQIFWENGTHETVKPSFDLELRNDFTMPVIKKEAKVYLGTKVRTEGRDYASNTSFDPISLDYHAGLETSLNRFASFSLGYNYKSFTTGLTVMVKKVNINYAFENNTELSNSHRISIGLNL